MGRIGEIESTVMGYRKQTFAVLRDAVVGGVEQLPRYLIPEPGEPGNDLLEVVLVLKQHSSHILKHGYHRSIASNCR